MVQVNKRILQFFSSLADETRLKIVLSLTEGSKNVGDIHKIFGKNKITLPAISHQLKLLESAGLIVYEKKGREKIFRLADGFCWCIVKDVFGHFGSGKKCKCKECCSIKNGKRKR
jgi:ArsR family transcriptional regulator, zinc-responsive transcriptional repressor